MTTTQFLRTTTQGNFFQLLVDAQLDEFGTSIMITTWNEMPDAIPQCIHLDTTRAAAVAAALASAVAAAESATPFRCGGCSEPIAREGAICTVCDLALRKTRRATLRAVPPAEQ